MEYLYATLLLHTAGKEINEENIKKVLEAAGVTPDDAKVKALIAALEGVNIDEVIKEAAMPVAAAPVAQTPAGQPQEEKKEEEKKKEEEAKRAEEAAAGLSALFG